MADVTSIGALDVAGTSPVTPVRVRTSASRTDGLGSFPALALRTVSSVSSVGVKGIFPLGFTFTGSLTVGGAFPASAVHNVSSISTARVGGASPTLPIIGLVSSATLSSALALSKDVLLVLNSAGVLTSTLTLTRDHLLSLLSTMAGTSSFSMLGVYRLSLLGGLVTTSLQTLQSSTGADLPSNAAVWVVNLDTAASAQYDDYGFNSFFRRGNDYFGVANDGIYKLSGDTDAGAPINALAAFARSSLGMQTPKHVPAVYIGTASDGALVLRVDADNIVRYYKARTTSADLHQHRVDIGRGVRGVYWEFELLNQNGGDFELADVTLLPVGLDRRV